MTKVLTSYARQLNLMMSISGMILEQLKTWQRYLESQINDWQDNLDP